MTIKFLGACHFLKQKTARKQICQLTLLSTLSCTFNIFNNFSSGSWFPWTKRVHAIQWHKNEWNERNEKCPRKATKSKSESPFTDKILHNYWKGLTDNSHFALLLVSLHTNSKLFQPIKGEKYKLIDLA